MVCHFNYNSNLSSYYQSSFFSPLLVSACTSMCVSILFCYFYFTQISLVKSDQVQASPIGNCAAFVRVAVYGGPHIDRGNTTQYTVARVNGPIFHGAWGERRPKVVVVLFFSIVRIEQKKKKLPWNVGKETNEQTKKKTDY